jgi:hypothetical protein
MAKINVKKYEQWINFLETELYVKRDQLNALFYEAGSTDTFHDFILDRVDITTKFSDAKLPSAHKVIVVMDVCVDLALQGKVRNANEELNTLLEEASRIGLKLNLMQDFVRLDELPVSEDEEYTGRIAYILVIAAPNVDEMIEEETKEAAVEDVEA